MRISEPHQSHTIDQIHTRVSSFALLHDSRHGSENLIGHASRIGTSCFLGKPFCKHVQQQLTVTIGINVSSHIITQLCREFLGVYQISIVRDANSVGIVGIQRLRFSHKRTVAGSWVSHMANAAVAGEIKHVVLLKDVADEAIVFAKVQPAVPGRGHHASSVLAAMLQDCQSVIEELIDLCCVYVCKQNRRKRKNKA
jgi:hypothetical protein